MADLGLSVVIPAFNAAATLGAAVDSAFAAAADEVIVVDDGSTDVTADVARRFGAHVLAQPNRGASVARQTGLRTASGRYVVLLDADDELVPDGVRASVKVLDDAPAVVAAGGTVLGVRPDGTEREWPPRYGEISRDVILRAGFGPWPPGCAVIRRTALAAADARLPPSLHPRHAEDFELFLRLAATGTLVRHSETALRYRMYGGKSTTSALRVLESKQRIRKYYGAWFGIPDHSLTARGVRCEELLYRARHAQVTGEPATAVSSLARAAAVDPAQFIRSGWSFARARLARGR
ncbi:glycosyltransferase family 2 protein [Promicromonospora kroppenstedtii]|uniref:Glycosyltransferase family 2 protein n=1 Tax=Promicromonospora kroppenstedtii TaxID=440482 RepID=A0ABW7XKU6_9MICO